MKKHSLLALIAGIACALWAMSSFAQVIPKQLVPQPMPLKTTSSLHIWPSFDCIPTVTAYYDADQQTPIAAIVHDQDLRVVGKMAADGTPGMNAESQFGRDLTFKCPVRIPPGSSITSMRIRGAKYGGNAATETEDESFVDIGLMQGNADPNILEELGLSTEIRDEGVFDTTVQGPNHQAVKINSDGYPVFVNIAFSEPNVSKDSPRGWNFYLHMITIKYQ